MTRRVVVTGVGLVCGQGIGTDIYMGHFVNGTVEWRIALTKDGTIMRIALGPQ